MNGEYVRTTRAVCGQVSQGTYERIAIPLHLLTPHVYYAVLLGRVQAADKVQLLVL